MGGGDIGGGDRLCPGRQRPHRRQDGAAAPSLGRTTGTRVACRVITKKVGGEPRPHAALALIHRGGARPSPPVADDGNLFEGDTMKAMRGMAGHMYPKWE
jgi:hypothetical protein